MPLYYKKKIPVEAIKMKESFEIVTLEGVMRGKPGDYLCTDIHGNQYPVYGEIFEQTYELVEEIQIKNE